MFVPKRIPPPSDGEELRLIVLLIIFAFVKPKLETELTSEEILEHCSNIASYKRPQHVEIWPVDKLFPTTRSTKVDKLELKKEADIIVEELRKNGKWDA